ncbi:MAG: polysaccharide biosynthesis protein [Eubacteriales bacterium]|nr:polysaccharide biosynthesis protein [Eubacteriales bacterium]
MAESNGNDRKFIKGAAILAAAGLIVKVLGAVFRIPLGNMIGAEGMSYYGSAYTIYSVLVVMATAGFPIAISRMVSERIGKKEYRNAHEVFRVAMSIMAAIGLVMFVICFFGAGWIAAMFKNPGSKAAIRALSPALFVVPLLSAFRGYFNGRQNMNPSALSEIMEQLVRLVVGLGLAMVLMRSSGRIMAAAGASFGAAAGSIGGFLIIFLIYLVNRKAFRAKIERGSQRMDSRKFLAKSIILIAVPIIIGSEIMPIMNFIDTTLIMRVLQNTGWTVKQSKYLYGILNGFTTPLIGFPQFITQAVTISLVPAVARDFHSGRLDASHDTIRLGYRTTMIMAFPCALGLFFLAEPILKLLYFAQPKTCADAKVTLMVQAVGVIFLALMQTSTSILQAIGKQTLPVRNLLIACVAKLFLTYLLVGVHAINVNGAAIGTDAAYFIAMTLDLLAVRKYSGARINADLTFVRPFFASLGMGICALGVFKGVSALLSSHAGPMMVNMAATLAGVLAAVIVYVILIFALKAITLEELRTFPKGDKLAKIASRFVK